jgi:cell division protein FtsW
MVFRKVNLTLFIIASVLIVFGIFMVASAGVVVSQEKYDQTFYFAKNQILKGLLPGLALGLLAFFLPYKYLRKFSFFIFLAGLILLSLVYIPGIGLASGGAKSWVHFGIINFQPSEVFKLCFIVYLAAFLEKIQPARKAKNSSGLMPFLAIIGIIALLIGCQPDFGTLAIFILTGAAIYFAAHSPLRHLFFLSAMGFGALAALIKFFPHVSERIQVLINPQIDPKGIGYQMDQGLIALGSGGIFGQGLTQGRQKFNYLPQPAGDSIVAVIGEELGFAGLFVLTSLFLIFAFQGFKVARQAPDEFSRLLAIGLTCLIVIQAFVNILAIIGLLPLTGITLPFVSYGGTSLAVSMIAVGILLNISKHSTR